VQKAGVLTLLSSSPPRSLWERGEWKKNQEGRGRGQKDRKKPPYDWLLRLSGEKGK